MNTSVTRTGQKEREVGKMNNSGKRFDPPEFDTPIDRHNVDFIHRLFDTEAIENCSPKLCDIFWVIMSLVIALLLGVCACSALRLLDIISDCIDECR